MGGRKCENMKLCVSVKGVKVKNKLLNTLYSIFWETYYVTVKLLSFLKAGKRFICLDEFSKKWLFMTN